MLQDQRLAIVFLERRQPYCADLAQG